MDGGDISQHDIQPSTLQTQKPGSNAAHNSRSLYLEDKKSLSLEEESGQRPLSVYFCYRSHVNLGFFSPAWKSPSEIIPSEIIPSFLDPPNFPL